MRSEDSYESKRYAVDQLSWVLYKLGIGHIALKAVRFGNSRKYIDRYFKRHESI